MTPEQLGALLRLALIPPPHLILSGREECLDPLLTRLRFAWTDRAPLSLARSSVTTPACPSANNSRANSRAAASLGREVARWACLAVEPDDREPRHLTRAWRERSAVDRQYARWL